MSTCHLSRDKLCAKNTCQAVSSAQMSEYIYKTIKELYYVSE
jgi:hypothetical protein